MSCKLFTRASLSQVIKSLNKIHSSECLILCPDDDDDMVYRMRLCTSVTDFEVERAKNQLKTAILSDVTNTSAASWQLARQVFCDKDYIRQDMQRFNVHKQHNVIMKI